MAALAKPIRLPNGQLIGQPGSNGGGHRGPDKAFPRRHIVTAIFLGALGDPGAPLEDLAAHPRRKRRHRKGQTLIPAAMVDHCKQGLKNIAMDAALGDKGGLR